MDTAPTLRIVVVGLGRKEVATRAQDIAGPRAIVTSMTDVEGAIAVRDGRIDFLIGVCQSGAGGALAMAVAFLGRDKCASVTTMGRPPVPDTVRRFVGEGRVAFGVSTDQVEPALRMLLPALLDRQTP